MGKIILIALAVVLLFVGLTVYQVVGVLKMINDKEFEQRLKSVGEGNCTYYQAVLSEMDRRISHIKFSCMNPVLVFISSRSESDLCKGVKDSENNFYNVMEQIKEQCEQK